MAHNDSEILETMEQILVSKPRMSLPEMSATLRIGRHRVERLVRGLTALSFHAWRESLLMKRAAARLVDSDDAVKKIAIDFGYGSSQAFSRCFKRFFGITPTGYRQRELLLRLKESFKNVSSLPQK